MEDVESDIWGACRAVLDGLRDVVSTDVRSEVEERIWSDTFGHIVKGTWGVMGEFLNMDNWRV